MKRVSLLHLLLLLFCVPAFAQLTEFTYQGRLVDGAAPASGTYEMRFRLFDADTGGNPQPQPGPITLDFTVVNGNAVTVTNGVFTVKLDFTAAAFPGAARFLEINVRRTAADPFTLLNPRQPITSAPHNIKSLSAQSADISNNSLQLGGVAANQYVITTDPRMTDERMPTAGSNNYIQNNPLSQQTNSSFNINGTGKAGIFEAGTQFNINGNRILSNAGLDNLFAGQNAGRFNTGSSNAFFGRDAGSLNSTGSNNSFFGRDAGINNDEASGNTFFGNSAGFNSFGPLAGSNTFVGFSAGSANTNGRGNTMLGSSANSLFPGTLINSTAIGSHAFVTQNHSLILGGINGLNGCSPPSCDSVNVGIGTTAPSERLHVVGNGLFTGNLTVNGTLNANLPISGSYIQNNPPTQQSASFNINGNGTIGGALRVVGISGGTGASFSSSGNFEIDAPFEAGGRLKVFENGNVTIGNRFANNARLYVEDTGGAEPIIHARNDGTGLVHRTGILATAANSPGYGTGGRFFAGNIGVSAEAQGEAYTVGPVYGVHGLATGLLGTRVGVFGHGQGISPGPAATYGVWGVADGPGQTKYGVYGEASGSGTNWAGYFAGNTYIDGNLGIGTTAPTFKLQVIDSSNTGLRVQTNATGGTVASFGGNGEFRIDAPGLPGARFMVRENGEVSIGETTSNARLTVTTSVPNGIVLRVAGSQASRVASFGGNGAFHIDDITTGTGGRLTVLENGNVGIGNNNPPEKLNVNGNVALLLASAGSTQVCQNGSFRLSTCSSSLRYKQNINEFRSGLELIQRLRPITFDWKDTNKPDMGLVAEEVAEVEPLLVTYNDTGEVEGIKYDRVGVVLINAVKEQQAQIERLTQEIETLKKLICASGQAAEVCKERKP